MFRSDVDSMTIEADFADECLADMEAARESDRLDRMYDTLRFLHEHDERIEAVNCVCDYLECGNIPILCE